MSRASIEELVRMILIEQTHREPTELEMASVVHTVVYGGADLDALERCAVRYESYRSAARIVQLREANCEVTA